MTKADIAQELVDHLQALRKAISEQEQVCKEQNQKLAELKAKLEKLMGG